MEINYMSNLFDRVGPKIFDGKPVKHVKPVVGKRDYALNGFQMRFKEERAKVDMIPHRSKSRAYQQDKIDDEDLKEEAQVGTQAKASNGFNAIKSNQKAYQKSMEMLREHAKAPGNSNRHAGLFASGFNRWALIDNASRNRKNPEHETGDPVDGMNAPKTKQLRDTRS